MTNILLMVSGLKIELYIKNEKPLRFPELRGRLGDEYLGQIIEVPRRYMGKKATVKIYPESIFRQNKSMVIIKKLVEVKAHLNEEKIGDYLRSVIEKLTSSYNSLEFEKHQEPS